MYVVTFRGGQGKWQVSTNERFEPQWSRDGEEFHYFNQARRTVLVVPVKETNGALQFGAAQPRATHSASPLGFYDVSPDGKGPMSVIDSITMSAPTLE